MKQVFYKRISLIPYHIYFLLELLLIVLFFSLSIFLAESSSDSKNNFEVILPIDIINIFPHDPKAFTQGLVWKDGFLYESTGLYGFSSLRKVELDTGSILQYHYLADDYFGEGMTIFKNRIYQLTWKEQTGFIYDGESFQLIDTFFYSYEGWGITHNEKYLIISDGTPVLHFLDPYTMEEVKQIEVYYQQTAISYINELEYIKGKIFANIWQTENIAIINPESGEVINWLDLKEVLNFVKVQNTGEIDVLNGIAYDVNTNHLFITGKLWPKLFEIKVRE